MAAEGEAPATPAAATEGLAPPAAAPRARRPSVAQILQEGQAMAQRKSMEKRPEELSEDEDDSPHSSKAEVASPAAAPLAASAPAAPALVELPLAQPVAVILEPAALVVEQTEHWEEVSRIQRQMTYILDAAEQQLQQEQQQPAAPAVPAEPAASSAPVADASVARARLEAMAEAHAELLATQRRLRAELQLLERHTNKFAARSQRSGGADDGASRVCRAGAASVDSGGLMGWKARHLVLREFALDVFASAGEARPLESLDLQTASTAAPIADKAEKRAGVEIQLGKDGKRRWRIAAASDAENAAWLGSLRNRLAALAYLRACAEREQSANEALLRFLAREVDAPDAPLELTDQQLQSRTVALLQQLLGAADFAACRVSELVLTNSSLKPPQVVKLLSALVDGARSGRSTALRVLDLSLNDVGYFVGPPALAEALIALPALRELALDGCRLRDEGVRFLTSALPRAGGRLERLVLAHNRITCVGASALAEALLMPHVQGDAAATRTSLVELDLSRNFIASKGAFALRRVVDAAPRLSLLLLADNRIPDDAAIDLAAAVAASATLTRVDLSLNCLTDAAGPAWLAAASTARSLTEARFLGLTLGAPALAALRVVRQFRLAEQQ